MVIRKDGIEGYGVNQKEGAKLSVETCGWVQSGRWKA